MVAVPAAFAVTTPVSDTVATEVLLDDQVTDLSVAFSGRTVGINISLAPTVSSSDVLSRLTLVTAMGFTFT